MNEPITVIVAHRLGKVEAMRRLDEGLARAHGEMGSMIKADHAEWNDNVLHLRISALGQSAAATILVEEASVRIEVSLPWLLQKAAARLLPALRGATAGLLEKR